MNKNSSLKIAGIIPARFASSRLPGKPLIEIAGKSLLQRTYENAKKFQAFQRLIIATDDHRIFEHGKSFGADIMLTPSDCLNGTARLAYVVSAIEELQNYDYIFNVQGDEPLIAEEIVNQVIKDLSNDKEAVVGTAAVAVYDIEEAARSSVVKCVLNTQHQALYFSRATIPFDRDQKGLKDPLPFYKHLGVYCYQPQFLLKYRALTPTYLEQIENLEQLRILEHGYKIKVSLLQNEIECIGVDTEEDVKKLEKILKAKQ